MCLHFVVYNATPVHEYVTASTIIEYSITTKHNNSTCDLTDTGYDVLATILPFSDNTLHLGVD